MGNQLEKQYGLKEQPIKLPGSYNFLKYADHPIDRTSSLIIIKSPHKAGIIPSDIILPIKTIKTLTSDYSVATVARCKPIGLVKPRSETQLKIIMSEIIKEGTQIGRLFLCNGKIMVWCEQIHNNLYKSPQEVEGAKINKKSKVFKAGITLANYLNYAYEKEVTTKKKKDVGKQMKNLIAPKDLKQYQYNISHLQEILGGSNFWNVVSEGMKNLLLAMLSKDPNTRIELQQLKNLPYFSEQKQLKLYALLADEVIKYDEKETIIFMQTLQMVIKNRIIFDQLILEEYLKPMLANLLQKKPDMILSSIVELEEPPINDIFICLKKASPQNYRLLTVALNKRQRLFAILGQEEYDAALSRTAFCCFQSEFLLMKLLQAIPYLLETIQEPNYKKQIEFQLITNILEVESTSSKVLLLALKCTICIVRKNLISNVGKLNSLKLKPEPDNFELNLHILELYRIMILENQAIDALAIIMPKLTPFLANMDVSDEVFFMAKRCVDLIMLQIEKTREINPQDNVIVDYPQEFFEYAPIQQPSESQKAQVLESEAIKSKNKNIAWLSCILQKQKSLLQ